MKKSAILVQLAVLLAGTAGVLWSLWCVLRPEVILHPRREYDLELRFVLSPPLKKAPAVSEKNLSADTVIPEKLRPLIIGNARKYGLPPGLVAAVIARESGFDHRVRSPDGGMGLMQLMPAVVKDQKCRDPFDPEENIRAGSAHLASLRERFPETLTENERLAFALAAYNGGIGHVFDARKLAVELKLSPDSWSGNVEEAMLFLKYKSFYRRYRYGYCNADIVTDYVRSVMALWERFGKDDQR